MRLRPGVGCWGCSVTERPSYTEMLADDRLVAAARRMFNDHDGYRLRLTWDDLPDEFSDVPLGAVNYRYLFLSYAWSALKGDGDGR